ncbi:helix-turn-helix domain-containing protein [Tautonia plasticadhaerens]|uniref:Helix-turn-helix domain protein n=1 Tax=Tautonia plasticadhaerens TaxID=2527974 RepID=A0A518GYR5_9BACT|nr:helix-turn-helix domain-containing protein [Tautonia plasticadhaerens]QDV33693.1 Helix-turn-helix domain protein [Tautonia plasticadhaerens]
MDIESKLDELILMVRMLDSKLARQTIKEVYSTEEFAELAGLKPKTVRDYCAEGRLKGTKKRSGHGRSKEWAISHAELERFQRDGLLPRQQGVDRLPALAGV